MSESFHNLVSFIVKNIKAISLFIAIPSLIGLMVADRFLGECNSIQITYMLPIIMLSGYVTRVQSIIIGIIVAAFWGGLRLDFVESSFNSLTIFSVVVGASVIIILFIVIHVKEKLESESKNADTDELTGISNRRYFNEILGVEFARGQRLFQAFTVAYIDLDNFKMLNDKQGHGEGDIALKIIANILSDNSRNHDISARIGGDEFVMFMPGFSGQEVKPRFTDIHNKLNLVVEQHQWPISFSIGVVTFNKLPGSLEEISKITDETMYQVKKTTKSAIKFSQYP